MSRLRLALLLTSALVPLAALPAFANPLDPNVVAGSAAIAGQGTADLTVNQSSDKAIIDWRSFNIGVDERTTFVQPTNQSVVLNRVTGGEGASQILGTLKANGQVFLVNPDGILFGKAATVDVGALVATTHDVLNADFLAGNYRFDQSGNPNASIVNLGTITVEDGGFAALVAPGVRNAGIIRANLGKVGLASANSFALDFYGDGLIQLAVDDATAGTVIDLETGKTLEDLASNSGLLSADGGTVQLTAAAARAVVNSVINNTGNIEADTVGVRNGKIVLGAATAATKPADAPAQTVKVSGALSAAGRDEGETGGKIELTGEIIELTVATIDAFGWSGGGTVLVGGDRASLLTAATVAVDQNTMIDVDARTDGDGGKVVVWADDETRFAGTITARGSGSGDGGFVETSGATLQVVDTASVSTAASGGKIGTWLLDPNDFTIAASGGNISGALLSSQLASNDITISTIAMGSPGGNGDIFVNDGVNWSANMLTLNADRNIEVNMAVNATGTAGIVALYGQSDAVGEIIINAPVNIAGTGSFQTKYADRPVINYTVISSLAELQSMGPTGAYALGTNIDASTTSTWNGGAGFSPIGDDTSNPFSGLFTGLGHTVSGLNINRPTSDYVGLFSVIGSDGVVRELGLTDVSVAGAEVAIGGLAGRSYGTISGVRVTGTVVGDARQVGGLVGLNAGRIEDAYFSGAVSGAAGSIVGGLVGANGGAIRRSYSTGPILGGEQAATVFEEAFDDGVLNIDNWSYAGTHGGDTWQSISEHDGYLDIRQASTDNGGTATLHFISPLRDPIITIDQLHHSSNSNFLSWTEFMFLREDGDVVYIYLGTTLSTYSPDYLDDPINYDRPFMQIRIIKPDSDTFYTKKFTQSVRTSDLLDSRVQSSIFVDNLLGTVKVDVDGDGNIDFDILDKHLVDASLSSIMLNSYGWYTGHYRYVYDLAVVGSGGAVGGLVGYNSLDGEIEDSYWDVQSTGQTASGGGTGLTTAQFKAGLPSGYDPVVWNVDPEINDGYPFLRWQALAEEEPGPVDPPPPGVFYVQSSNGTSLSLDQIAGQTFPPGTFFVQSGTGLQFTPEQLGGFTASLPPPVDPGPSPFSLAANPFQASYTTSSAPFQPSIQVSGTGLNQITEIRWNWTGPNSGQAVWTAEDWLGRFQVNSVGTSATASPILVAANDPGGTYNWTVTITLANGQSFSSNFTVNYQKATQPPIVLPPADMAPQPAPVVSSAEPSQPVIYISGNTANSWEGAFRDALVQNLTHEIIDRINLVGLTDLLGYLANAEGVLGGAGSITGFVSSDPARIGRLLAIKIEKLPTALLSGAPAIAATAIVGAFFDVVADEAYRNPHFTGNPVIDRWLVRHIGTVVTSIVASSSGGLTGATLAAISAEVGYLASDIGEIALTSKLLSLEEDQHFFVVASRVRDSVKLGGQYAESDYKLALDAASGLYGTNDRQTVVSLMDLAREALLYEQNGSLGQTRATVQKMYSVVANSHRADGLFDQVWTAIRDVTVDLADNLTDIQSGKSDALRALNVLLIATGLDRYE